MLLKIMMLKSLLSQVAADNVLLVALVIQVGCMYQQIIQVFQPGFGHDNFCCLSAIFPQLVID